MPIVDFLVATPLDEEWRAFERQMPKPGMRKEIPPAVYTLWEIQTAAGPRLVVGVSMGDMGIGLSGATLPHALAHWRPQHVFLLGIAGTIQPKTVKLGDVVVSEQIHGYECGPPLGGRGPGGASSAGGQG